MPQEKQHQLHKKYISHIVLLAGIAFIALGIFRGENAVVLQKAINICMECIGIG